MNKKAAVTGGTGFVGTALIEHLINDGWEVTALARDPARLNPDHFNNTQKLRVVEGSLGDPKALANLADGVDAFFHLAGLTHAKQQNDYRKINVEGAVEAAKASRDAGALFVHTSSMSARMPNTSPYAQSKFDSESAVSAVGGRWVALRLPAIYGPRDMVTLPIFKLVKSGLALEPRTEIPARASILFVEDAALSLVAAAQSAPPGHVYEVGDERRDGFAWSEINAALGEALGTQAKPIRVPRGVISLYHGGVRGFERLFDRAPSVREGQINEFFHPDWVARENLLSDACGWQPQTSLKEGFAKTAHWYQKHGLL